MLPVEYTAVKQILKRVSSVEQEVRILVNVVHEFATYFIFLNHKRY